MEKKKKALRKEHVDRTTKLRVTYHTLFRTPLSLSVPLALFRNIFAALTAI